MASLPEHIKNLLFEQDCVVIPDFGGFITNFHSSTVHENSGSLVPPRKRIAFNEVLHSDDGLLSSFVAVNEGKSREEALTKIHSFAEHIRKELKLRKSFRFENLGVFTLNTEGKLVFEPDNKINYYADSFGMAAVHPRYVRRPLTEAKVMPLSSRTEPVRSRKAISAFEEEEKETNQTSTSRRWLTLPNMAAAAAVGLVSLMGWSMFDADNSALSSLNPIAMLNVNEWILQKPAEDVVPIQPATPAAPLPQPIVRETDDFLEIDLTVRENTALAPPLASGVVPVVVKEAAPKVVVKTEPIAPAPVPTLILTEVETKATPEAPALRVPVISMNVKKGEGKTDVSAGRYYVVAGGFGQESNALKLGRKLRAQGYSEVTVLYPESKGLIKVGVGEFDNAAAASKLANRLRFALGNSVWVLKSK
ncbi:MAG: SPOR domain-containing protein [Cytophagaceae bacterium]|nr:SPOR domain-containing protein [Cytophagaceae bacterium]